jgi:hypothetical protein
MTFKDGAGATLQTLVAGGTTFPAITVTGVSTLSGGIAAAGAGTISLGTTSNTAGAITLQANGGTSETVLIQATQGTGATSINLVSTAGGITLNCNGASGVTINAFGATSITNDFTVAGGTGIGAAAIASAWGKVSAGTTARAQFNFAASTAPTSPNNGDFWFDGTNVKIRVAGATKTFTIV